MGGFTVKGNGINWRAYADNYNGGEFVGANEPKRLILGFMLTAALLSMDIECCNCPDAIACGARSDSDLERPYSIGTAHFWAWHGLAVLADWVRRSDTANAYLYAGVQETTGTVSFSEWIQGIPWLR